MSALATQVIAQLCPSGVGKTPCKTLNKNVFTGFLTQAINSRSLPPYTKATGASSSTACSPYQTGGISGGQIANALEGSSLSIASHVASAGSALASALPVIGTIASLVTGIIGIVSAHHAQAVRFQDSILCQSVPAVNSLFADIDAALQGGSITPAEANQQYQTLITEFTAEVTSDPSYNPGDALGGYLDALKAVIIARTMDLAKYTAPPAPPPAPVAAVATQVTSTAATAAAVIAPAVQAAAPVSGSVSIGSFSVPLWALLLLAALILGRLFFNG